MAHFKKRFPEKPCTKSQDNVTLKSPQSGIFSIRQWFTRGLHSVILAVFIQHHSYEEAGEGKTC